MAGRATEPGTAIKGGAMAVAAGQDLGVHSYYQGKIDEMELVVRDRTQNLERLKAQRNELNAKVRMLREELHHLQESGSYVGEVVKAMGKKKVCTREESPLSCFTNCCCVASLRVFVRFFVSRRHSNLLFVVSVVLASLDGRVLLTRSQGGWCYHIVFCYVSHLCAIFNRVDLSAMHGSRVCDAI